MEFLQIHFRRESQNVLNLKKCPMIHYKWSLKILTQALEASTFYVLFIICKLNTT